MREDDELPTYSLGLAEINKTLKRIEMLLGVIGGILAVCGWKYFYG